MLNLSGAQVVPCTPKLSCLHSTPLSSIQPDRFYSPAELAEATAAPTSSDVASPLVSPAWTPIPRVGYNRYINCSQTTTPIPTASRRNYRRNDGPNDGRNATSTSRKKKPNQSLLSVYENQLVPQTPASDETPGGNKRTRIKSKTSKSKSGSSEYGSQSSGSRTTTTERCQDAVKRPYFTLDDRDIFSDDESHLVNSPAVQHITGEDESEIFL